jgi:hypothetical protein
VTPQSSCVRVPTVGSPGNAKQRSAVVCTFALPRRHLGMMTPPASTQISTECAQICLRLVAACGSCLETVRRTATLAIGDLVCKRVWDIRPTVVGLLAPLAEAGACEPLPSSLAFARSSRTAARQPGRRVRCTPAEDLLPAPTLAADITYPPSCAPARSHQFDRFGGAPYR